MTGLYLQDIYFEMVLLKRLGYLSFDLTNVYCGRLLKSTVVANHSLVNRRSASNKQNKSSAGKWFMLIFPAAGIALGTWQVRRKQWKLDLIANLNEKTKSLPILFPSNLDELEELEYRPLIVRGAFSHSHEIYVEPRQLIEDGGQQADVGGSLLSVQSSQTGAQVITPFFLPDHGFAILINRGYVSKENRSPETRQDGQVPGIIELKGILRHSERQPPLISNNPESGQWSYKDIDAMAEYLGTKPILLDAIDTMPNGPVGGQTRVSLRDEHVQYAITWYSLAAITAAMWYLRYLR